MSVPQQFVALLQAPVLPAKTAEAQKISGLSLSIPVPSGKIEGPAPDLDSVTTADKRQRELPLPSDALQASKSVISMWGKAYATPCQPDEKYQQSVSLALSVHIYPTALPSAVDLVAHFQLVKQIFAPEAFESAALAFAADFNWPDGALS